MRSAMAGVLCAGALVVFAGADPAHASAAPAAEPFTRFVAVMRDGEVAVDCALSLKPDLARLVIRYRTDGVCPADAGDGSSLADVELPRNTTSFAIERKLPAVPGAASSCFAAFVNDRKGALRGRGSARVDVPDQAPPEPATNLRRSSQP